MPGGLRLRDADREAHVLELLPPAAEVAGGSYRCAGLGECQHTEDASIYEVPAAMWSARVSDDGGTLSYLNLTVKGAALKGSGTGRVSPRGQSGTLVVEGWDAAGGAVKLTVDCSRFSEPVAEGG